MGTGSRYKYRAYGLNILSELKIPQLVATDFTSTDVLIRLGKPMDELLQRSAVAFDLQPTVQNLVWKSVGAFQIRNAQCIDIQPAPGASERLLLLPLLGPVMAMLLHQRGLLVLHASGIAIDGRGAIFLGDKQAGKSTIAAALVAAGHELIADDVLAISFQPLGALKIIPAIPLLKLDSAAADATIGHSLMVTLSMPPEFQKSEYLARDHFSSSDIIPSRVFVLERGARTSITQFAPAERLTSLIRFSYVSRFGPSALSGEAAITHLRQCAAISTMTEMYRLDVSGALSEVKRAVMLVEDRFA